MSTSSGSRRRPRSIDKRLVESPLAASLTQIPKRTRLGSRPTPTTTPLHSLATCGSANSLASTGGGVYAESYASDTGGVSDGSASVALSNHSAQTPAATA